MDQVSKCKRVTIGLAPPFYPHYGQTRFTNVRMRILNEKDRKTLNVVAHLDRYIDELNLTRITVPVGASKIQDLPRSPTAIWVLLSVCYELMH